MVQVPVCICCHDDWWHLEVTLKSFATAGPATVFVSKLAWDGKTGDSSKCVDAAQRAGAEVVMGDWGDESTHRRFALAEMKRRGHANVLIPDSDEVVSPELLRTLHQLSKSKVTDLVRVRMATYWKSPRYVVQPPEQLAPILMLDCRASEHLHIREYSGSKPLMLGPEHGVLHHLSYVGPDERILRKIETWGHRDELVPEWFDKVWHGWDHDRFLRNLHPTHPSCFGWTERIETPHVLAGAFDPLAPTGDPEIGFRWPKLSVVIPVYGGPDDLRACLQSLAVCKGAGVDFETIVVDDASPDDAPAEVLKFPDVKLIRMEFNQGFAAACNRGLEESGGEAIIFLNSDTRVPSAGLIRLVETLQSSGLVGAAGPHTNAAGYHQPIAPNYTRVDNLDNFARDFAEREACDVDVPMLVGFCLAVRRSVLDEVGPFDTSFGQGLFEDTDLVYRIQRAGYKTRISTRSYVHHEGSRSLSRLETPAETLLEQNRKVFENKWQEDLKSGFASHLSGQSPSPIEFHPEREPHRVRQDLAQKARKADISLCMIVKNEERVLGECLKSVQGVFSQIVVVDTGSTDRTAEIAREYGAEVYNHPWTDSFAEARNASLSHARGRWIFWLDADDTLPLETAKEIVHFALSAPPDVIGSRVRVQFVDEGPAGGTRVDHVKLFRNLPGVQFTGHIHEQILGSLRKLGGRIELIQGPVLHSGYDTSVQGQKNKRKRDRKLLGLDLASEPKHPFYNFNLGMTAFYCGRPRVAKGWLKRSIRHSHNGDTTLRKAFALHGLCEHQLGRTEAALQVFQQGLNEVGEDPELRFRLAQVLLDLGRHEEAIGHLRAIGGSTDEFFASVDMGILTFRRDALLGEAFIALGDGRNAKAHLAEAIKSNPWFRPAILRLFEIAIRDEDVKTARNALAALLALEGPSEEWTHLQLQVADALGMNQQEELDRLIRQFPQAVGPKLVLTRGLLQYGNERAAYPLLQDLAAKGNAESAFNLGVLALKRKDYHLALRATQEAVRLNPYHGLYRAQYEGVQAMLRQRHLETTEARRDPRSILGPHLGKLGKARCEASVLVVGYNSSGTIRRCLQSALAELGSRDEMIVVDNASTDDTASIVERLAMRDPRVRLIGNKANIGYSKACNQALLASGGRRLVALNPDAVLSPGALKRLIAPLSGRTAAVGPVADNVGASQFVGFYLDGRKPPREELAALLSEERSGELQDAKLLMGFCLALRRDVLDEVGLLCEETELGADDLELSWRLRELGYELKIAVDAFIPHESGHSFAASPDADMAKARIRRSDRALVEKLVAYYGWANLPTSDQIWGCDIFDEAFARSGKHFAAA